MVIMFPWVYNRRLCIGERTHVVAVVKEYAAMQNVIFITPNIYKYYEYILNILDQP